MVGKLIKKLLDVRQDQFELEIARIGMILSQHRSKHPKVTLRIRLFKEIFNMGQCAIPMLVLMVIIYRVISCDVSQVTLRHSQIRLEVKIIFSISTSALSHS